MFRFRERLFKNLSGQMGVPDKKNLVVGVKSIGFRISSGHAMTTDESDEKHYFTGVKYLSCDSTSWIPSQLSVVVDPEITFNPEINNGLLGGEPFEDQEVYAYLDEKGDMGEKNVLHYGWYIPEDWED